ncbi:hypothetical protein V8F20_008753 [Naviculisporaceae sp. PSN 640]
MFDPDYCNFEYRGVCSNSCLVPRLDSTTSRDGRRSQCHGSSLFISFRIGRRLSFLVRQVGCRLSRMCPFDDCENVQNVHTSKMRLIDYPSPRVQRKQPMNKKCVRFDDVASQEQEGSCDPEILTQLQTVRTEITIDNCLQLLMLSSGQVGRKVRVRSRSPIDAISVSGGRPVRTWASLLNLERRASRQVFLLHAIGSFHHACCLDEHLIK